MILLIKRQEIIEKLLAKRSYSKTMVITELVNRGVLREDFKEIDDIGDGGKCNKGDMES